jgi:hypothetical protein
VTLQLDIEPRGERLLQRLAARQRDLALAVAKGRVDRTARPAGEGHESLRMLRDLAEADMDLAMRRSTISRG